MTLPLLPTLLERLRANAGDYATISRTLAEAVCVMDGALAAGVYLRDYAGETLFLAGRFPEEPTSQEETPRLSAESWDDPLCYCLHTGLAAAFTQLSELPESARLVSTSPQIGSCKAYPIKVPGGSAAGCALALYGAPPRGAQAACQTLCLYAGALLELARGRKQNGYALQSLEKEVRRLKEDSERRQAPALVGESLATHNLRAAIARVSASNAPLLITGETGTGKSLLARMVHEAGNRSGGPFLAINCGALSAGLLESELFGHVKGAFSGAVSTTRGLLRSAEGGTVFLDEIGEMPPQLQVALLQVLQERKVRPVGGTRFYPVNMRVIAATNRDVDEAMKTRAFRRDLYHRLAVLKIHIPPLRERREDIPGLCAVFLERCCRRTGRPSLRFSPEALLMLLGYSYPGNIRELESLVERAVNTADADCVELGTDILESCTGKTLHCISLAKFREMQERWFIQQALRLYGGDMQACSRALDVHPRTLRRRMASSHTD